jgi:hypothetical protein
MIIMNTNSTTARDYDSEVVSIVPPEIEEDILASFGHAIVEFEDTLYVKFQQLTKGIVLTKKEFIEYLENMEERDIVVSGNFLGKKCWAMGSNVTGIRD